MNLDRDIIKSTYLGCFEDTRLGEVVHSLTRFPEDCIRYCSDGNFRYAGVSNGSLCICLSTVNETQKSTACFCNAACQGTNEKTCGGRSSSIKSVFRIEFADTCYQDIKQDYWQTSNVSYLGEKMDHCYSNRAYFNQVTVNPWKTSEVLIQLIKIIEG